MVLSQKQKGILTICGGFTTHLVCGTLFNWGNLNIYITSYFRSKNEPNLSIQLGASIFPVMMCCIASGIPIGIYMIKIFGSARKYLYLASFLTVFFQFISSYAVYFWQYVLAYSIGFGLTTGTIYFIPLYMAYLYFPLRKGLISGIILCGYGLSSFLFGMIFFQLINPKNMKPEKASDGQYYFQGKSIEVVENVPIAIRYSCIIYITMLLFGSSLVCYHPNQIGEEEKRLKKELKETQILKQKEIENQTEQQQNQNIPTQRQNEQEILNINQLQQQQNQQQKQIQLEQQIKKQNEFDKQIPFQVIAFNDISFTNKIRHEAPQSELKTTNTHTNIQLVTQPQTNNALQANSNNALVQQAAPSIKAAIFSRYFLITMIIGILSIGFGILISQNYKSIGKAVIVDDKFMTLVGSLGNVANGLSRPMWSTLNDKYSFKFLMTIILISEVILALTLQLSFSNQVFYLIWVFLIITTMGGILNLFPVLSARLYGVQIGSRIFGLYWYGFAFANFMQFILVQQIEQKIGFKSIFYIYVGFQVTCFIILHTVNFVPDWTKYVKKK